MSRGRGDGESMPQASAKLLGTLRLGPRGLFSYSFCDSVSFGVRLVLTQGLAEETLAKRAGV